MRSPFARAPLSAESGSRRARTALALLEELDQEGIEHCVLRNHEEIPVEPGRDIDLLARDEALPVVERILAPIAAREGWSDLVRCRGHHEGTSYYLIRSSTRVEQLELHFTRIRWADIDVLTSQEVLARRVRSSEGIWIADPVSVGVQRIMQFGLSGQLMDMKQEYWDETRYLASVRSDELAAELTGLAGDAEIARGLVRALAAGRLPVAADLISRQRTYFVAHRAGRQPISTLAAIARRAGSRYLWRAKSAYCGVVVVAGDEDLAQTLAKSIDPLFLRIARFRSEELDPHTLREAQGVVKRAGAVVVITDQPLAELERPDWGETAVFVDDPSGVEVVIRRFLDNHMRLYPTSG